MDHFVTEKRYFMSKFPNEWLWKFLCDRETADLRAAGWDSAKYVCLLNIFLSAIWGKTNVKYSGPLVDRTNHLEESVSRLI